ncbi:MAG: carboxypeptidase regulatory-like domain-containing protein, partial [Flavobacteriia bacterium]|nr:carboxypeptidase regulatory-like domain-containing protein [Flavobacteriia bacterium]
MKFFLFPVFLWFSFASFSQRSQGEGVVLGKVIDQKTKSPLEYAKVKVFKAKDSSVLGGQFTDSEGKFNIEGLPYSPMLVLITFTGYDTVWYNEVIPSKELRLVNLGEVVLMVNNQRVVDEV